MRHGVPEGPNAEAPIPGSATPDTRAARADPRVAGELYRTALVGDRRVVAMTVLGALFVASLVEQQSDSRAAWPWCAACVAVAGVRLLLNRPARSDKPAIAPLDRRRWLALLFLASATWGLGPPLFLLDDPSADTLVTGIFLAAAGLTAPLLAAWRPAVYVWLLPALLPLLVTLALRPLIGALPVPASSFLLASFVAGLLKQSP